MEKAWRKYTWLMAAATIMMGLLLLYQLADIYANHATGQMYTYENVAMRLRSLRIPGLLYVLLSMAGVIRRFVLPIPNRKKGCNLYRAPQEKKSFARLRLALYVLAAGLLAWGVINGGLWDVLVKAINICTECIGLG